MLGIPSVLQDASSVVFKLWSGLCAEQLSLGQLPLVVLNLSWTGIETLPLSLQTMTTLRIIDLSSTRLGADVEGAPIRAADIARRDAILRPLSLAIPDLRFSLHSDERGFGFMEGARMHWWHARCGHDWWEDVFFSPPHED